jgi:hypothetical protein
MVLARLKDEQVYLRFFAWQVIVISLNKKRTISLNLYEKILNSINNFEHPDTTMEQCL